MLFPSLEHNHCKTARLWLFPPPELSCRSTAGLQALAIATKRDKLQDPAATRALNKTTLHLPDLTVRSSTGPRQGPAGLREPRGRQCREQHVPSAQPWLPAATGVGASWVGAYAQALTFAYLPQAWITLFVTPFIPSASQTSCENEFPSVSMHCAGKDFLLFVLNPLPGISTGCLRLWDPSE